MDPRPPRSVDPSPSGRFDVGGDSLLDTVTPVDTKPKSRAAGVARRAWTQLVVAGLALSIFVLSVERIPTWLLARAADRSFMCLEVARRGELEPARCQQRAWLAVPRWVPHTRAEAVALEASIHQQIAGVELEHATEGQPDRVARDRAAHALGPKRAREIHLAGAFEVAAALDVGAHRLLGGHWPALSALTLGDLEGTRARIVQGGFEHHHGVVAAGALACLVEERDRGLELLSSADRIWRAEVDVRGHAEARLAIAHCGGTVEDVGLEPTRVVLPWLVEAQLVRAYDPEFQVGRRGAFGRDLARTSWLSRAGVLGASVLAATEGSTPVELVAVAAGGNRARHWTGGEVVSPHLVLSPGRYDHVPPAWIEAAAERFEAAVAEVPEVIAVDDLRGLSSAYGMTDAPLDPRGTLRDATFMLWRAAAVFRVRGGDRVGAASALARAQAIDVGALQLTLAPLQLALDDPAGALETLERWRAAHAERASADERALASFNLALARMSLGEHESAHSAALEAIEQLGRARGLETYVDGFEWLVAATAIASGRVNDSLPLREPNAEFPFVSPASWVEVIRTGTLGEALHQGYVDERATRAALVAEVYVVERAAASSGDPEVAADAFFASLHPSRALARARAEAARWQGDDTRAERWRDRAETLERLMTDDHRVALAGLAGVW